MNDVRISVNQEFAEHFNKIKTFRDELYDARDSEDPKNIMSAMTTFTTIIKELSAIQQQLYSSERIAILQQIIVNTLKEVDSDLQYKVLKAYEEAITRLS